MLFCFVHYNVLHDFIVSSWITSPHQDHAGCDHISVTMYMMYRYTQFYSFLINMISTNIVYQLVIRIWTSVRFLICHVTITIVYLLCPNGSLYCCLWYTEYCMYKWSCMVPDVVPHIIRNKFDRASHIIYIYDRWSTDIMDMIGMPA